MTPKHKPAIATEVTMVKEKTKTHPFETPNVLPMDRKLSPLPTRAVCRFMIFDLLNPSNILKCYKMFPKYRLP